MSTITTPLWLEAVKEAGPLLRDYLQDAMACKLTRVLPNKCVLIQNDKVKTLLIVERTCENIFFCPICDDCSLLNMKTQFEEVKKDHCVHTFVAKILMGMSKSDCLETKTKDQIFIVQETPSFAAVVYPKDERRDSKGAMARPGAIVKTARMTKKRCKTCKGREGCYHLGIYKQSEEESKSVDNCESQRLAHQAISAKKTEIATDLIGGFTNTEQPVKGKSKTKNELNPENFHGDGVNVFNQKFEYPPTKEDQEKNNLINKVKTLFPSQIMVPIGLNTDRCKCGNVYDITKYESSHPIIHHSKPTTDSRNSIMSVHFLATTLCSCKKFYHGEKDRLVRVSSAPAQPGSNVNFVSVDLLNEYLCSLFGKSQEGKSIDAFVNGKNDLNSELRGDNIKIARDVFFKAFEIYIHATKYDAEEAFGCPKCPGELLKGEKETDFENVKEVHVTDGIDMGCMQNENKGFVEKEIFRVPRVETGEI